MVKEILSIHCHCAFTQNTHTWMQAFIFTAVAAALLLTTVQASMQISCDSTQWPDGEIFEPLRIIACDTTPYVIGEFFACKCMTTPIPRHIPAQLLTYTMSCGPMISVIILNACPTADSQEWRDRLTAKRIAWNEILQAPGSFSFESYKLTNPSEVRLPHVILGRGHVEIPHVKYINTESHTVPDQLLQVIGLIAREHSCKRLQEQSYARGREDGSRDYITVTDKLQQILAAAERLQVSTGSLDHALKSNARDLRAAMMDATQEHCVSVEELNAVSTSSVNELQEKLGAKLNEMRINLDVVKNCLLDGMGQQKLDLMLKQITAQQ